MMLAASLELLVIDYKVSWMCVHIIDNAERANFSADMPNWKNNLDYKESCPQF